MMPFDFAALRSEPARTTIRGRTVFLASSGTNLKWMGSGEGPSTSLRHALGERVFLASCGTSLKWMGSGEGPSTSLRYAQGERFFLASSGTSLKWMGFGEGPSTSLRYAQSLPRTTIRGRTVFLASSGTKFEMDGFWGRPFDFAALRSWATTGVNGSFGILRDDSLKCDGFLGAALRLRACGYARGRTDSWMLEW